MSQNFFRKPSNFHCRMPIGGGYVLHFIADSADPTNKLPLMCVLIDENNAESDMMSIMGSSMDDCRLNAKIYLRNARGMNRLLDTLMDMDPENRGE